MCSPWRRVSNPIRLLAALAAFAVLAALGLYHLDRYPAPWYDEGVNLQAARNLAAGDGYGLTYGGNFELFDPQLTTGPTVIGPVALVFRLSAAAGVDEARLVIAGYTLLAGLGLFWLACQIAGWWAATLAVASLAAVGDYVGVAEGRAVVGEVPALAFLFLGAAALVAAAGRRRRLPLTVLSGALLGLAILTKAQLATVVAAMVGLWVLPRLIRRAHDARLEGRWPASELLVLLGVLVLPLIAWQLTQLLTLGTRGYVDNLLEIQAVAHVSSEAPPFLKVGSSLAAIRETRSAWAGLLALGYVWVRAVLGDARFRQPQVLLVPAFTTLAWLWFGVFSMGWLRLEVPAVLSASLGLGILLCDVAARLASTRLSPALRPLAAGLVVLPLAWYGSRNLLLLDQADDAVAYDLAALVDQRVSPNATIETDEWELDVLMQPPAHHPPVAVVVNAVGSVELHQPPTLVQSYEAPGSASYLIDGRFSKIDGIYRHVLEEGEFAHVATLGDYDLYQRVGSP